MTCTSNRRKCLLCSVLGLTQNKWICSLNILFSDKMLHSHIRSMLSNVYINYYCWPKQHLLNISHLTNFNIPVKLNGENNTHCQCVMEVFLNMLKFLKYGKYIWYLDLSNLSMVFWVCNVAKSKFVLILDYVLRRLQHDYFHHNS